MNETKFALSEDEESYYAAACYAAGIVFSPIGGILSGCIGRKKSIIIISLLGIVQTLCNFITNCKNWLDSFRVEKYTIGCPVFHF